ncbi:MAG: hypothetical protein IT385_14680 [Deltaproteobacteria bacterium]|nr:hypothetical protein [Deltaproteobacteria bacterium]
MFDTSYDITGNTILDASLFADGISLQGATAVFGGALDRGSVVGSRIARNDITMVDSLFAGVGLYGDVDRTVVMDNAVCGTADAGIVGYAFGPFPIEGRSNVVRGNDLSELDTTTVHVGLFGPTHGGRVEGNAIGTGGVGVFLDGAHGSVINNDWSASDQDGGRVVLGPDSRKTVVNERGFPSGDVRSEVVDLGDDNHVVSRDLCE